MRLSDVVMWLGFSLILIGMLTFALAPREEVKTNCYDRYGSEIEELECNKTVISSDALSIISLVSLLFGLMAILASFVISFEEMMRW